MKLISITAENFGSYKNLHLDFDSKGLTLISGPTGAGKSTIMDSVSWVLFGKTAKNGTADEVVKWGSTETTRASIVVELLEMKIIVIRTRLPNDLYMELPQGELIRGKDLKDTQLKINEILGITPDTFLAAVYMHEFSLTSEFFQTNAKNRRQIMEQITDLSLAKTLQESTSEYTKMLKQDLVKVETDIKLTKAVLCEKKIYEADQIMNQRKWQKSFDEQIKHLEFESRNFDTIIVDSIAKLEVSFKDFEEQRTRNINSIKDEAAQLESQIQELDALQSRTLHQLAYRKTNMPSDKCLECGSLKNAASHMLLQRDEHKCAQLDQEKLSKLGKKHTLLDRIERYSDEINPYASKIEAKAYEVNMATTKLEIKRLETNPYDTRGLQLEIYAKQEELSLQLNALNGLNLDLNSVKLLQEVIQQFRGAVISNTVQFLQNKTNKFLETHFDSEFKVAFTVAEADSLDTEVYKDGILCSYTQLSKGQRQMLKLCFGAAIQLAVANYSGVQFNTIFMDEVLTGLDETNKGKAFGLIQELSAQYENIYIIEHNENFKTLFTSRIDVSLENGNSVIL